MIIVRRPWGKQPPSGYTAVNSSLKATAIWCGADPTLVNLKGFTAPRSASVSIVSTIQGRGALFTATTSNSITLASDRQDIIANGPTCIIAVLRRSRDTTNRNSTLFGYNNSSGDRVQIHAPFLDGNLYWDCGNATAGSGRVSVAFTKTTQWETLVFYAGVRGREVYRNGTLIVSNASATASIGLAIPAALSIGSVVSTGSDSEEVALCVIASNKEWYRHECVEWCRNPYGMTFAPLQLYLPTIESSIVTPTLTSATAINITTTSARARVAFTR